MLITDNILFSSTSSRHTILYYLYFKEWVLNAPNPLFMAIFHAHKQVPFYPELPFHGIIIWCFWSEFQKRGQTFWHFFMSCCSMSNKAMKWERLKFIWNSSKSFNHFEEISKKQEKVVELTEAIVQQSPLLSFSFSAVLLLNSALQFAVPHWND